MAFNDPGGCDVATISGGACELAVAAVARVPIGGVKAFCVVKGFAGLDCCCAGAEEWPNPQKGRALSSQFVKAVSGT